MQTKAAHDATRGRFASQGELLRRAADRHTKLRHIGYFETAIAARLEAVGLKVSQQTPVGKYNIDVTIDAPPIAVEVRAHDFGFGKPTCRKRLKYILDQGWTAVYIASTIMPSSGSFAGMPSACRRATLSANR